jgi:hypothetical protein
MTVLVFVNLMLARLAASDLGCARDRRHSRCPDAAQWPDRCEVPECRFDYARVYRSARAQCRWRLCTCGEFPSSPKLTIAPSFPPKFSSLPPRRTQLLELPVDACHRQRYTETPSLPSSRVVGCPQNSQWDIYVVHSMPPSQSEGRRRGTQ